MDNGQVDLAGALSRLLDDPEALRSAAKIAAQLQSSGALDRLIKGGDPVRGGDEKKESEERAAISGAFQKSVTPALRQNGSSADRKKLLEALRPYVGKERRERLDTIMRVLDLIELAGSLGIGKPRA